MKKKLCIMLIATISSLIFLFTDEINIEDLIQFHEKYAGVWDRKENLNNLGMLVPFSWGRSEISVSSLVIIDLYSRDGKELKNRINIANEPYEILEIINRDRDFILKLKRQTENQNFNDVSEFGYYLFSLSENKDILTFNPILSNNEILLSDVDHTIAYVNNFSGISLYRRSGPKQSFDDK